MDSGGNVLYTYPYHLKALKSRGVYQYLRAHVCTRPYLPPDFLVLSILRRRYASGEISREEYLQAAETLQTPGALR
jgi:hypothetical protein